MQILLVQILCRPVWVEVGAEVSDTDVRPRHEVRYIWVKEDAEWPRAHVWLSATPWTVAHQVPLLSTVFQARILEWVAISFSRGSFGPRDGTHVFWVSCVGRWSFTTGPPGEPVNPASSVSTLVPLLETCPGTGKMSNSHDKWVTSTMDYFSLLIS